MNATRSSGGTDIGLEQGNAACVGKRIRAWRLANNMTQTDLARATGISQGMISHIELGSVQTVPVRQMRAFARAFGMPLTELFVAAGVMEESDMAHEQLPGLAALVARIRQDVVLMAALEQLALGPHAAEALTSAVQVLKAHASAVALASGRSLAEGDGHGGTGGLSEGGGQQCP